MGAVYRATDTKLNRDVAIKVLPESFAADRDRMARFEREAQVLASLNHPNIAQIYGIEQGAIVMELVEGDDLKGPLPIDTAIDHARQIAAGLEAAHEKGIVHRDLKPANIKVTPAGVVKLLDFGLAKATENAAFASSAASPTISPTLSLAMTQTGMILGTAAYMSPEQARGKPVDQRADIWAFGVVLFEMLAGSAVFGGETVTDTIASVVKQEPDWKALPPETPPHLRKLLERCLRKDPKRRMQSIGDVRLLMEEPDEVPASAAAAPAAVRRVAPWWSYATMAICLVLAFLLWRATRPVEQTMQRFTADMGPDSTANTRQTMAISPDGTRIVFPIQRSGGQVMLATRLMDQSKATVLSGTEGAAIPFFSPDGQWIGFSAGGSLKKVSVLGGAPVVLCAATNFRGASWGPDGYIVASLGSGVLSRVPEAGGEPQSLGKTPSERQELRARTSEGIQRWPQILPGGETVLLTFGSTPTEWDDALIEALNVKTGESKVVVRGGYYGRYLPSGHLVYVHQGTLFAVPFDLSRLEPRRLPVPILDDIAGSAASGGGQLDFSRTGTFAYLSGKPNDTTLQLNWLDASGKRESALVGMVLAPKFSPGGKHLVGTATGEVRVYDLERGGSTRLPSTGNDNVLPTWTPDGKHIVYSNSSGLWWIRADGSGQPELLLERNDKASGELIISGSISPDGRWLAYSHQRGNSPRAIWTLPLDTADPDHPKAGQPELFVAPNGGAAQPAFSPDGRWLAYTAYESSSKAQVIVRPFPGGASGSAQVQISTTDGLNPIWSRNGRELFYLTSDGHIMVVAYTVTGGNFTAGKPRRWGEIGYRAGGPGQPLDLAPDGTRFIVLSAQASSPEVEKANLHITFLLNFFDELKRKLPPGGK